MYTIRKKHLLVQKSLFNRCYPLIFCQYVKIIGSWSSFNWTFAYSESMLAIHNSFFVFWDLWWNFLDETLNVWLLRLPFFCNCCLVSWIQWKLYRLFFQNANYGGWNKSVFLFFCYFFNMLPFGFGSSLFIATLVSAPVFVFFSIYQLTIWFKVASIFTLLKFR